MSICLASDDSSLAPVNILVSVFEPYIFGCSIRSCLTRKQNYCDYPGILSEIVYSVLRLSHIPFHVVSSPNISSGSQTEMLEYVRSNSMTCTQPWFLRQQLPDRVKPTADMFCEDVVGLYSTVHDKQLFPFLSIFTPTVWICLGLCFLLIRGTFTFYDFIMKKKVLLHPNKKAVKSILSKDHIIIFTTVFALFTSLYENQVLSQILLKSSNVKFKGLPSVIDSIDKGDSTWMELSSIGDLQYIMNISNDAQLKRLSLVLKKRPFKSVDSSEDAVNSVLQNPSYIYADYQYTMQYQSSLYANLSAVVLEEFGNNCFVMVCNEDVPDEYIRRINESIILLRALRTSIIERYSDWSHINNERTSGDPVPKDFHMGQFEGYLIFLAGGLLLSAGGLLLEWAVEKCYSSNMSVNCFTFMTSYYRKLVIYVRGTNNRVGSL